MESCASGHKYVEVVPKQRHKLTRDHMGNWFDSIKFSKVLEKQPRMLVRAWRSHLQSTETCTASVANISNLDASCISWPSFSALSLSFQNIRPSHFGLHFLVGRQSFTSLGQLPTSHFIIITFQLFFFYEEKGGRCSLQFFFLFFNPGCPSQLTRTTTNPRTH